MSAKENPSTAPAVRIVRRGTCISSFRVDLGVDLGVQRWVIISMMVLCNANAIIEYGRRRSGLPSAPLVMGYGNNSIEQYSSKHETHQSSSRTDEPAWSGSL